jgi:ribonucleoside-diphosphate reductase alpha chain
MTERRRLPNRRARQTIRFSHNGFQYIAGVGHYADGALAEIFISTNAKSGTAIEAWARDSAILASIAFQYGTPVDVVRHALTRDEADQATSPLGQLLDILAADRDVTATPETATKAPTIGGPETAP